MKDEQLKKLYPKLWKDVESCVYEDLLWFLKRDMISHGKNCSKSKKNPNNNEFKAIAHNAAFTACAHIHRNKEK